MDGRNWTLYFVELVILGTFCVRVSGFYDFEVAVFVGTPQDDESYAVTHDPLKNRFLTGETRGSLYASNDFQNATWFVSGYQSSSENSLLAAQQRSSSSSEYEGQSIVSSPDGQIIYCCGVEGSWGFARAFNATDLSDIWDFQSEGIPLYGIALDPNNPQDVYAIGDGLTLIKLDANGSAVWNVTLGNSGSCGTSLAVFNSTVYFTGYDNSDIVIGAVDSTGSLRSLIHYGSTQNDFGTGIVVYNGAIFVTGYTDGNFSVVSQNLPFSGNFSLVVMSVNMTSMQPNWIDVRASEFGNAKGLGISRGLLNGTIYIVGYSDASFGNQTGLGNEDILWATYNVSSGFDSAVLLGSSESDIGYGISVAPDLSDFFISGSTSGQLDPTVTPFGGLDIFVLKGEIAQPPSSKPNNPNFNFLAIGIAVGFVAAALLIGGAAFAMYKRSIRKFKENHKNEDIELPSMEDPAEKGTASRKGSTTVSEWDISYPSLTIGKELGRGAFGVVYKCRWRNTDCVVKQLDLDRKDPHSVKAFLKEANNVRTLRNHPNVCSILGVCTNPEYPICIVMEFLPEGNLLDMIVEQRLEMTLPLVVRFAKDIASGMSHLHDENILHCDLACRNLLVDSRNRVYYIKISDFGLSRVLEAETYSASASSAFPVRWTAPEALKGGRLSRASDVWSFGVTLWEMIEGGKPYPLMSNPEVITAVCDNGYRLPRPTHLQIPDSLYELMFRCWETRPKERPSFNEIYEELSKIEKESEIPNQPVHTSQYMTAQDVQSTFANDKTVYSQRTEYEQ